MRNPTRRQLCGVALCRFTVIALLFHALVAALFYAEHGAAAHRFFRAADALGTALDSGEDGIERIVSAAWPTDLRLSLQGNVVTANLPLPLEIPVSQVFFSAFELAMRWVEMQSGEDDWEVLSEGGGDTGAVADFVRTVAAVIRLEPAEAARTHRLGAKRADGKFPLLAVSPTREVHAALADLELSHSHPLAHFALAMKLFCRPTAAGAADDGRGAPAVASLGLNVFLEPPPGVEWVCDANSAKVAVQLYRTHVDPALRAPGLLVAGWLSHLLPRGSIIVPLHFVRIRLTLI